MLGGALLVIQSGTTDRFDERIRADLDRTYNLIDTLMRQRHQLLADNGYTLTGDGLIIDMLRERLVVHELVPGRTSPVARPRGCTGSRPLTALPEPGASLPGCGFAPDS